MLLDEIKAQMFRAMKEGRIVEKEILRVAVGDITTQAARETGTGSDAEAQQILRKLVKSDQESLAACTDPVQRAALELEITTLLALLPQSLSVEEIVTALSDVADAIRAAGNVGQATGLAMKQLKAAGATVGGKDVTLAVQQLRG